MKPDNKEIFNDLQVVDATRGICKLELTSQALAVPGNLDLELVIMEGESKLSTMPFTVDVIKSKNSAAAIESSNEYKALDRSLTKVEEWNNEFADKSGKLEELYTERLTGLGTQLADIPKQYAKKGSVSVADINKNLGKFDQTYMTDEFLQQIVGNAPINSVPRDKSITMNKLAFAKSGKNLFNKNTVTQGFSVSNNTGELVVGETFSASEYIPYDVNTDYVKTGGHSYAIYDAEKVFVSGAFSASFRTPSTPGFVRISVPITLLDTYQLEKGTVATTYEPYQMPLIESKYIEKVPVGLSEIPDLPLEKMDFSKLKSNLFNKDTVTLNSFVNDKTGALTVGENWIASDFISVIPEQDFVIKLLRQIAYYTKDKVFISGLTVSPQTYVTSIPSNCGYIRFSWYTPDAVTLDTQQVNKGRELLPYEPYGYVISKEYTEQQKDEFLLFLPSIIYVAVGRTIELYNNQVSWCGNINNYHFKWDCKVGKALKRKFSVTGTSGTVGDYPLTLTVYDNNMNVIAIKTTIIKIVNNIISNEKNICCIGDSLTNMKIWLNELDVLSSSKLKFIGTRTWNYYGKQLNHEGRSGFSAKNYLTATEYTFGGEGVHPFWDGTRFNWNHYKTTTGINPSAVQIFLGTNGIALDPTENANNIKQIVDYIRQDDATIPIYVAFTLYRGNQNGLGVQTGTDGYSVNKGAWKLEEDRKVFNLMVKLYDLLKSYANLHFMPIALTHDSEYNFGAVETPINPRASQKELMPTEATHPQEQGYLQFADCQFSVFCGTLN